MHEKGTTSMARPAQPHGVDAAVALAALGYHVQPCRLVLNERGIKVPSGLPAHWQSAGFTTEHEVRARWAAVGANAYLVVCGPSGVTGVDLDRKPGVDGVAAWSAAGGPAGAFVVATPGGGQHHYFASGGAVNGQGVMPGVDVRGVGGGLFGPGSSVVDFAGREVGRYAVAAGTPVRSTLTVEPLVLRGLRRAPTTSAALDPFFAPAMTASAAADRARREVAELAAMPYRPGTGMRQRINDAALFLGGLLHTGWFTHAEAAAQLTAACDRVFGSADGEDVRWIETALTDGARKPLNVVADAAPAVVDTSAASRNGNAVSESGAAMSAEQTSPGSAQTPDFKASPASSTGPTPRRLPMIGDQVWNTYGWCWSIRERARSMDVCPDALLGAMLATYSSRLHPGVRIDTGTKMPLGANLVVSLVGPSGSDKSTAFRLAELISPASSVPVVSNPNSGEAFAAQYVQPDPDAEGPVRSRSRVLKPDPRALFYVAEGGLIAGASQRAGSTWLPHLRALAMDEALSTTNATAEINRQVPDGSYSAGVVVGFQATTAMTVLSDTATGTAQRFLWFTALGSEQAAALSDAAPIPMAEPRVTGLAQSVDRYNTPLYTITVVRSITDRVRAEQRHIRLTRDIGATDDHDAHRHVLVAKLAALAVLADGRDLIGEADWAWAEAVYAASAAVRDELLSLAEDREQHEQRASAVRMADNDHVRKSYAGDVVRVAEVMARWVERHGPARIKQQLRDAVQGKDRPYFTKALEYAEAQGWVLRE